MRRLRICATVLMVCFAVQMSAVPGFAQQAQGLLERGTLVSPILIIDRQKLLFESAFGQRIRKDADAAVQKLQTENRIIYSNLEAEEQDLTEKRSTMSPEAFRPLADAFDEKVQEIRKEQDAKSRALNQSLDKNLEALESAAVPVLEKLMRDSGAAVILERRSVFLSARIIDVTDEAIARLDATLGDGTKP